MTWAAVLAALPGALFAALVDRVLRPAPAGPVRAAHRRAAAARVADTAVFAAVPPGARWLVCDTTVCAHLTTRHVPDGGKYRCTGCDTIKGAL
ncbi:hypothetical protein OEIGOIKO_05827 [Streptomyces chrestomyceticus JCM 4735]|uniref:Uncharacterized protein n=1 Tax=Streptomyces chrestomyceticus JCM 4735 TaxID=1306181 RepID=A0A7U9PZ17_9ACTN|nr:hypothetical protein [Streptomyces chrestomyceticus]GCD38017.1 hypothetical protein OEIGOIKO_05827 [Streptomyces chrestomyceticus JCM 4735]